ncbi:MAG: hypothetical protein J6D23_03500 [Clostridia bacterium]|nr:hypothetical protein [Clostridia bacterium]
MKKISYFSYKGGAGRSSIAYNTIPYLAKKLNATPKRPILVFDLDLDSAGLTFLLKKNGADIESYSLQDALASNFSKVLNHPSRIDIAHHAIFQHCIPVGKCFGLDNDSNSAILFVPTKRDEGLNRESNSNFAIGGVEENRFKDIIRACEQFDFAGVIFDTPAGNQATAQWALELSDTVATCMRITYQFRIGTEEFLNNKLRNFSEKKFVIIPNAVPIDDIKIDGMSVSYDSIKKLIVDAFGEIEINNNKVDLTMVGMDKDFFGVNEVKRFKIQEDILFKIAPEKLSDDEKKAIVAYKLIVDCLASE